LVGLFGLSFDGKKKGKGRKHKHKEFDESAFDNQPCVLPWRLERAKFGKLEG
jgi:hypothetical protein